MSQQPRPKSPLSALCVIFAEVGITVLGVFALVEGVDGAVFVSVIVALAGLGGYQVKRSSTP